METLPTVTTCNPFAVSLEKTVGRAGPGTVEKIGRLQDEAGGDVPREFHQVDLGKLSDRFAGSGLKSPKTQA
ncbi:MAG TPA: hypothetical protein PLX89_12525 [Verrucomicrobiota bacterium]|nr:hypothetical protein [Verrucomicrobiota bacterium]